MQEKIIFRISRHLPKTHARDCFRIFYHHLFSLVFNTQKKTEHIYTEEEEEEEEEEHKEQRKECRRVAVTCRRLLRARRRGENFPLVVVTARRR